MEIYSLKTFLKKDYHTRVSQVVNVGRDPASVGQFLQVVGGLVISANENCHNWCNFLAGVILREKQNFLIRH